MGASYYPKEFLSSPARSPGGRAVCGRGRAGLACGAVVLAQLVGNLHEFARQALRLSVTIGAASVSTCQTAIRSLRAMATMLVSGPGGVRGAPVRPASGMGVGGGLGSFNHGGAQIRRPLGNATEREVGPNRGCGHPARRSRPGAWGRGSE